MAGGMAGGGKEARVKGLNFRGQQLHFVQVGLGTFSTFIQNCAGAPSEWSHSVDFLLGACSERRPSHIRGVAVEPLAECVADLRKPARKLPHVELVQVALGEVEVPKTSMTALTVESRDAIVAQAAPCKQERMREDLVFLMNMGFVGGEHPALANQLKYFRDTYEVQVPLQTRRAAVWTWEKLARTCNFRGCEVLMVDAEGYDCRILRSMMAYCAKHPRAWPKVIQFETIGHCDKLDWAGAEWDTIQALERSGYILLHFSTTDCQLVCKRALRSELPLQKWVESFGCKGCGTAWRFCNSTWHFPYVSGRGTCGTLCWDCYSKGDGPYWGNVFSRRRGATPEGVHSTSRRDE